MTSKAIAILLHDFNSGGTEATALRLAAEWVAQGHRVTIVAGSDEGPMRARVPVGVAVRPVTPAVPRGRGSRRRLARAMAPLLADLAPDVAYIPGNYHFWLARGLRRALPHLPLVAKISNPLLPPLPAPAAWLARRVLRRVTDPIDLFVAMAPELAAHDAALLPGRPIRVAPEPNLPRGYRAPSRTALEDPPLILAIGRLEPQKDFATALRAFATLRKSGPARLAILGEGRERARLERLACRLGIAGDVAMPGFVEDVPRWLARASLLLMTSRYEGFPAACIEALAADVPVVATDCSPALHGLLATPQHGGIATVAALPAEMARVLALPSTSGDARPATAAPYAAPVAAHRYLALFDEAIASCVAHRPHHLTSR